MRGSVPAPGQAFVRYGGETSCVALQADGSPHPDLLLDAGTGIRSLEVPDGVHFNGRIVLSHLHWDHLLGLPFASALLDPRARLTVVAPVLPGQSALDALLPGFRPPSFPVPIDELAPGWRFEHAASVASSAGWTIRTEQVRHKGGPTIGVRVERGGRSLVYLPDHDLADPDLPAEALATGADVLLHDAQYLAEEIAPYRDYGHSTVERAIAFGRSAGVRHLVLTHHAPQRTDPELDEIAERFESTGSGMRVSVARQGMRVTV